MVFRTGIISPSDGGSTVFLEYENADLERRGGEEEEEEEGTSKTTPKVDANSWVRQSYSEKTLSMG